MSEWKLELHIFQDESARPSDYECYDSDQTEAWEREEWRFVGIRIDAIRSVESGASVRYESNSLWAVEFDGKNGELRKHWFQTAAELLGEMQADFPELADVSMGAPCTVIEH